MSTLSKYSITLNIAMKDLEEQGYSADVKQPKGKPYQIVEFKKGDETCLATTCKDFTGKVTRETLVVFGHNANNEERIYLTNNANSMTLVEKLF